MRTISQVAELTGISTRTLQYYDEIGLLKPGGLTGSGYRLYDDEALQMLQQILFFKELGFKLKEIKKILEKPDFETQFGTFFRIHGRLVFTASSGNESRGAIS